MMSWMKNLNGGLPITEVNIPGSHDSCSFNAGLGFISNCQNKTIYEQLCSGIRFLDVRVEKKDEKLITVHSVVNCKTYDNKRVLTLDDVLEDCKKFLFENPSETILFSLKRDDGASSEETFNTFFNNYFNDEIWFKENRFPVLSEVRSKIVFINRCHPDIENTSYTDMNTGINFSGWPHQDKFRGKIFEEAPLPKRGDKATDYYLTQDMYQLKPKEKWEKAISPFLKNPPQLSGAIISFFSSTAGLITPKATARYINKKLAKTTLQKPKKYGWIIMDYPTERFIKEIINSNF